MKTKFSAEAFWIKLRGGALKAGHLVVYASLLLFYVLQKPDVPKRSKIIIIGALTYFIIPTDAIPDFAAGIGYTDDFGALGAALLQVAMYIDEEVKAKAKMKMAGWFGENVDTSEIDKKIQ
ncbi:DUF1232 domain-containing protein [Bacillus sp. 165]|uniref:YkvA family protein n=1 Tax=Bacillus sp. 165 TaxID=1529117 RepID=UPI001ADC25E5|nr:DUF1232 domain-containing protein [Bacillus sp. 165]MBO9129971.1 DUF1232 domain-containing protein [Bacillus sp. 165]